jgi:hypothetical protein
MAVFYDDSGTWDSVVSKFGTRSVDVWFLLEIVFEINAPARIAA